MKQSKIELESIRTIENNLRTVPAAKAAARAASKDMVATVVELDDVVLINPGKIRMIGLTLRPRHQKLKRAFDVLPPARHNLAKQT